MRTFLARRGFLSLLCTQFFGAANDNILKQVLTFMVATGLWAQQLGAGGQAYVALIFTLPFIFLSGFAGQVADRFSKQRVMVIVKLAEVPIAAVAMVGLLAGNLSLTLAALLLLGIQSAFFGPAKYGVIPELVDDGDLSRANGTLNMLTNIAIIAGTIVAGPVADRYHPRPDDHGVIAEAMHWLPGVVLLLVAALGVASILFMPRLEAQAPDLRYDFNPFATYVSTLREMRGTPLLVVTLAWAAFYLVGMMALLILPEYERLLAITYEQTGYLLGALAVSIGVGSAIAGLVSGHAIRPRLVPVGAAGMSVFFLLLGTLRPTFLNVGVLLCGAGIFAGFYMVPLQALLQKLSPDDERGRFLGTANALSFCCSTAGAAIFWIAANRFGMPANRIFLVCAALIIAWTAWAMLRLRGYWAKERV